MKNIIKIAVGPDESKGDFCVYAGKMIGEKDSDKNDLIISEIDLSLADKYTDIPIFKGDWQPNLYSKIYTECIN